MLENLCNLEVTPPAATQTFLPVKLGGLGFPSAVNLAPSAFLASAAGSENLIQSLIHMPLPTDRARLTALDAWKTLSSSEIPDGFVHFKQSNWSNMVNEASFNRLKSELPAQEAKRLSMFKNKHGGDWLHAIPMKSIGLKLTDSQIRTSIAMRLGSRMCSSHTCVCGEMVDERGLHGLACKKSAGRFSRHASLNDTIKRTLSSIAIPSVLEPPGLTRSDGRRPDGLTTVPWSRGKPMIWDVTVVDSLSSGRQSRSTNFTSEAERLKTVKYQDLVDNGYIFQPIAFDVQGNYGDSSMEFLEQLCRRLVEFTKQRRSGQFVMQKLSILIQIFNNASILGTVDVGTPLDEIFLN